MVSFFHRRSFISKRRAFVLGAMLIVGVGAVIADDKPQPRQKAEIDATSLKHKVLCGYQGWFRCPQDPVNVGWRHWSRDAKRIGPNSLTFEMWPDLTEFDDDEKYPTPGFSDPSGG